MQIFMVGGAVRDEMLGLPISDRDFVVVGASPEQMLAKGFRPVGKDFPVFLHPESQEEYALARTERKTAPGYKGFSFHTSLDVSLEEDLARRDLTINAMARAAEGSLCDPYGGSRDLQARILRHVSPAFAEDPVRILRLARFSARFTDFSVAAETMELMRQMVQAGEVDALVAERVWQELARGMQEAQPSRMFEVLRECGALARILPEMERLWHFPTAADNHAAHAMQMLDNAAQQGLALEIRFAACMQNLAADMPLMIERLASLQALCERLKVPGECRDLAVMCLRERDILCQFAQLDSAQMVSLFARCDAWRKPQRFHDGLLACACDEQALTPVMLTAWSQALIAAQAIDTAAIARQVASLYPAQSARIAEAILAARVASVSQHLGR